MIHIYPYEVQLNFIKTNSKNGIDETIELIEVRRRTHGMILYGHSFLPYCNYNVLVTRSQC